MNTNPFTTLTAGFAAILIAPAFAIEAPVDDAPPPPAAKDQPVAGAPAVVPSPEADANPAAVQAPVAYLGVVASDLPEMLAEHLGLKTDAGILVQALMPDGPASKAGVAVHDIITRIADQPVATALDLTKQVAAHKPGEKIRLEVIHQGKPAGLDVTLGTRPEGLADGAAQPLDQLNLDGIPKDLADRVRGAIKGNLGGIELKIHEGAVDVGNMDEAVREIKKRMEQAMEGMNAPGGPGAPKIQVQGGATFRMMDETGSIELRSNNGGKEVTARDKDNKITWTGPWDTDQDKAAAPDDVRQRMDRLHLDTKFQGNGLRLRLNGADQDGDDNK